MLNRRNNARKSSSAPPIRFIKEGRTKLNRPSAPRSILETKNASDWQINFDFFGNSTIPGQSFVDTRSRPDIVIFSLSTKTLLWFEETVPLERNIVDAAIKKEARYASLKAALMLKNWTVNDFTYEVGALGFISKSFNYMLTKLGFSAQQKKFI